MLNMNFDDMIQEVITRLSMYAGTSAQTYAEDRIGAMIQHKFDVLFDEEWWPQFCAWAEYTLDGSTGVVTADLSSVVKEWKDIRVIHAEDKRTPLPLLPHSINPYTLSGTTPMYVEFYDSATKIFRIWPLAATGDVQLHRRTKPTDFADDDDVNFDSEALILGACWDYSEDDGANPGAIEKFKNMFEARVRQLKKQLANLPTTLTPYHKETNTEWVETG